MIYNNTYLINNKKHNKLFALSIIIIVSFVFLIILTHTIKYKTYYKNKIIVYKNDSYYLKTYINANDINIITKNKKIIIDNKLYNYQIISIENLEVTPNYQNYQEITLEVKNLVENYKINNLSIDYKILNEDILLIKYIKKIMEE